MGEVFLRPAALAPKLTHAGTEGNAVGLEWHKPTLTLRCL